MSAKPLPKWVMIHYSKLWNSFSNGLFDYKQAVSVLKKKPNQVSAILSILRKNDWLNMELHKEDARKRNYKLNEPQTVIKNMTK